MSPSTEWHEQVVAGEEARFQAATDQLVQVQRQRSLRYGNGRALHRKQLVALKGTFEILPDLPAHAANGLFAKPGTHGAWIRLSNGSMDISSDKKPDVRGFAIKVLGVEGPGALGGTTHSQDFLLINRRFFGFERAEPFLGLVLAAAKGVPAVIGYFIRTYGFFAGLKRLGALQASSKQPFPGFAAGEFHTSAPLTCGPYAVRARLAPSTAPAPAVNPAPAAEPAGKSAEWAADLKQRLAQGPLVYDFQLQFFQDEATTPIEDSSRDWADAVAPFFTVARLTIPPQDTTSAEATAFAEQVGNAKFDPWNALMAHRPLGSIMRARKVAYFGSQTERKAS